MHSRVSGKRKNKYSDISDMKRRLAGTIIESKMEIIKCDENAIKNKKRIKYKEHIQNAGNLLSKMKSKR